VTVSVFPDRSALMQAAAESVTQLAERYIQKRGRFDWALAGGKTPEALYRLLAGPPLATRIDWTRVHFFWSDERCVPPDHADSNYRMARESLLDRVAPPRANVHRLRGELPPPLAASRYEQELSALASAASTSPADPPRLDLILLGMGADGHTASLFPGSAALTESKRWVVATSIAGRDAARLTFTLPLLNAAANVLFLVAGSDKARALAQVSTPEDPERLPAHRVQPVSGELTWLVDSEAAVLL
jgi:6-phosphogluconolactonase